MTTMEMISAVFAKKPIISDIIMNGDMVRTSTGTYKVEIQGRPGTYVQWKGKCINIAIDDHGFLRNIETGIEQISTWKSLEVIERGYPELFTEDGRYLKKF